MANADMEKAGGILAFVAGIAQLVVALSFAVGDSVTGSISGALEIFGVGGGRFGGPGFAWGWTFAYATLVISAFLISGAKGRLLGVALIVCAILSAFGGSAFALLAILSLAGGIIALIGGFGAGGSGLQGIVATAQRMAQAAKETDARETDAKETDAKDANETKG